MKTELQFNPDIENYAIAQMGFMDLEAVKLQASYFTKASEKSLKSVGTTKGGLFGESLDAKTVKRGMLEDLVKWVADNGFSIFESEYHLVRAYGEGDKPYLVAFVVAK